MWRTGQGTHVPLIVVGTGRWDGVMGVTSDVYPPSQEGESGEEERSTRKPLGQPQNKHSLCLPSCRRTEGSGYSQQGTKLVSCLIFPIAKHMPVSMLLTQVPEKRGEVQSAHKRPILSQPSKKGLFPRWPVPAQVPSCSVVCEVGEGVWGKFPKQPSSPMGRINDTQGRKSGPGDSRGLA